MREGEEKRFARMGRAKIKASTWTASCAHATIGLVHRDWSRGNLILVVETRFFTQRKKKQNSNAPCFFQDVEF